VSFDLTNPETGRFPILNQTFSEASVTRYHFDDVVVDCERFEIEKSGEVKKLTPRAFSLLLYLIENRDRVVEKSELFDKIWHERFVTDNALTRTVADIRRVLGDDAGTPKYIETVPKRGYRFVAELKTEEADTGSLNMTLPVGRGRRVDWLRLSVVAIAIAVTVLGGTVANHLVSDRDGNSVEVVPPIKISDNNLTRVVHPPQPLDPGDPQQRNSFKTQLPDPSPSPSPKKISGNPLAAQLYFEGDKLVNTLDPGKAQQGLDHFQRAIKLDPNFALAYVGVAHYYFNVGGARQESIALAKAAAERALELDPDLAEAYAVRGLLYSQYDWNFVAAEKDMKRALELDSTSRVVQQDLALQLALQGRVNESLTESRKALALDPFNAALNLNVGWLLYSTRSYNEAQAHFQQMIAARIYLPGSYSWMAQIYDALGRYDEAVEMDLKYRTLSNAASPETLAGFRSAYLSGGWTAYLEKILEHRKGIAARRHVEPFGFALIYARLGDKEQTLQWLERACEEKSVFVRRLSRDPAFDSLRTEPRFRLMLRQHGLV
jgi:DNA-binding winged helix-turn-helix (wHTH) protein/Tfp pilus assembly protein PilF